MCLLLETIQIRDGKILNLEYHNRRFNDSRKLRFEAGSFLDLGELIRIPPEIREGKYRCRILYRSEIEEIQFVQHKEWVVNSLKLVYDDEIEYPLKYADRDLLKKLYEKREGCDEILIIRNGFVTDTSISNVALRRKDGSWATPETCLLKGTMRTFLIETGRITEEEVRVKDLEKYTGIRLINCMMELDSAPVIGMNHVHP